MQSAHVAVTLACGLTFAAGAEWPLYLGPNGDNTTSEPIRTNWSAEPPRELWRKPIGPGYSSIAVSEGRPKTRGADPTAFLDAAVLARLQLLSSPGIAAPNN